MPQFDVKTKQARSVWKSPDGQREIFEVALDYNGDTVTASTYSKDIATEGWSGTVETYEKEGRNGRPAQTFVKQPPKEGGGYGHTSGSGQSRGSGYTPKDEKAIQAMWAIGQAVQLTIPTLKSGTQPELGDVCNLAVELNSMVDVVKAGEPVDTTPPPEVPDVVDNDVPAEMPADFLKDIDDIFPGAKDATTQEKPWPKNS